MKSSVVGLILGITACGVPAGTTKPTGGSSATVASAPIRPGSIAAVESPSVAPGEVVTRTIDLRLHGLASAGAVRVSPNTVEVKVDGQPVAVQLVPGEIDLGNENHAWKVATFEMPPLARTVAVRVALASQGLVERDGRTESLDLSGAPISFTVNPAQAQIENKVGVDINLASSITADESGLVFLPDLIVRY